MELSLQKYINCLHLIRIPLPVGDYYLVTLDRTILSPISSSKGILKGKEFSWQVMKYLPYISVDDFAKPRRFANDLGYKAILYSELFTFKSW